MSEEKKNKQIVFFTGISLGIVVGALFVYFTINTNIVRYPMEVSQKTIEAIVNRVVNTISAKKDSSGTKEIPNWSKQKNLPPQKNLQNLSNDTINSYTNSQITDSLNNTTTDSTFSETTESDENDESIKVRKDELLRSRYVDMLNIGNKEENYSKDSLAATTAGIRPERPTQKKQTIVVEFWQSPINYKGYKMSKSKIILYGIDPKEDIKLISIDNKIYLRTFFSIYQLSSVNEFRSLEKVNNPVIQSYFE